MRIELEKLREERKPAPMVPPPQLAPASYPLQQTCPFSTARVDEDMARYGTGSVPVPVVMQMIAQAERQHLNCIFMNQSVQNAQAFADSQRTFTLFLHSHNK